MTLQGAIPTPRPTATNWTMLCQFEHCDLDIQTAGFTPADTAGLVEVDCQATRKVVGTRIPAAPPTGRRPRPAPPGHHG
ncbi:hypothetical protein ACFYQ5_13610 [Streptomyces sp. NPDC005794]|uniref:hypothetical protein n=1 Tax=Streptomyces sp. NPDC005794 TaxID=3364733 RepID=UPI0036C5419C